MVEVKVRFVSDFLQAPLFVKIDSDMIAKFGTKAESEQWRLELKVGDEVDALDKNTGVFYNSTVIDLLGSQ